MSVFFDHEYLKGRVEAMKTGVVVVPRLSTFWERKEEIEL